MKYKYRLLLVLVIILVSLSFFMGWFGNWFFVRGGLAEFPIPKEGERILIIAPHIDDETIGAAGVILRSLESGAAVKVVYLTNGDDSLGSVLAEEKSLNISPADFIRLGQERMVEGKKAAQVLGLSSKDLIFLGFPDKGLWQMLTEFYSEDKPFFSSGTKFNHNPYRQTYKPGRIYAGENVVLDLREIFEQFKPTTILISHQRDNHSDHRAAFQFLQKALEGNQIHPQVFSYLVHYRFFPPEKKFLENEFLYPPRKLFAQLGWFSFELSYEEEKIKLEAVNQYKSQVKRDPLLRALVRRNEIFEEMEE